MADNFNTYIEHIEPEFWRELCEKEGKLRHFDKGEAFVFVGHVRDILGTYPDIFTWFSLKDIASFLAVTPTHLSRLRKNSKIQ